MSGKPSKLRQVPLRAQGPTPALEFFTQPGGRAFGSLDTRFPTTPGHTHPLADAPRPWTAEQLERLRAHGINDNARWSDAEQDALAILERRDELDWPHGPPRRVPARVPVREVLRRSREAAGPVLREGPDVAGALHRLMRILGGAPKSVDAEKALGVGTVRAARVLGVPRAPVAFPVGRLPKPRRY